MLFGSVTLFVAGHSSCPVAVVHPHVRSEVAPPNQPLDGSGGATDVGTELAETGLPTPRPDGRVAPTRTRQQTGR
jgi:hypothetical protein